MRDEFRTALEEAVFLVSQIEDYGSLPPSEIESHLTRLRELLEQNPDGPEMIRWMMAGLAQSMHPDNNPLNIDGKLEELRNLLERMPDGPEMIRWMMYGLAQSLHPLNNPSNIDGKLNELRGLLEQIPDDPEMIGWMMVGLAQSVYPDNNPSNIDGHLQELRGLLEQFLDYPEMIIWMMVGLAQSMHPLNNPSNIDGKLNELRGLLQRKPDDREMIQQMMAGLAYSVSPLNRPLHIHKRLAELRGLLERSPDNPEMVNQMMYGLALSLHPDNHPASGDGRLYELLSLLKRDPDNPNMIRWMIDGLIYQQRWGEALRYTIPLASAGLFVLENQRALNHIFQNLLESGRSGLIESARSGVLGAVMDHLARGGDDQHLFGESGEIKGMLSFTLQLLMKLGEQEAAHQTMQTLRAVSLWSRMIDPNGELVQTLREVRKIDRKSWKDLTSEDAAHDSPLNSDLHYRAEELWMEALKSLDEITQQPVPRDTLVLEWFAGDDWSCLFATSGGVAKAYELREGDRPIGIESRTQEDGRLCEGWQSFIHLAPDTPDNSDLRQRQVARLEDLLLPAGLRSQFPHFNKIVLCTVGALEHVEFGEFPCFAEKAISHAESLTAYLAAKNLPAAAAGRPICISCPGTPTQPLPNNEPMARECAEILEGSVVTKESATPEILRETRPAPSVLLLFGHGDHKEGHPRFLFRDGWARLVQFLPDSDLPPFIGLVGCITEAGDELDDSAIEAPNSSGYRLRIRGCRVSLGSVARIGNESLPEILPYFLKCLKSGESPAQALRSTREHFARANNALRRDVRRLVVYGAAHDPVF